MNPIVKYIKWIMLAGGLLTTTMISAAISPEATLASTFGESLHGPVANVIVRSWGVLIALSGVNLIHGAFAPAARRAALLNACASKSVVVLLILSNGWRFLEYGAGQAVATDSLMVVLFGSYLAASPIGQARPSASPSFAPRTAPQSSL
jgi:hypothetical protein